MLTAHNRLYQKSEKYPFSAFSKNYMLKYIK